MSTSSRDKVRAHRAALRAQGLRPIQLWVPDTRSSEFKAEAARQCRAIAEKPDPELDAFLAWAYNEVVASLPDEPEGWFDDDAK